MQPMLATPATRIPAGPAWVHEVKWDGMRVLVDVHDGQMSITSRNGNDVTVSYPELAGLAGELDDMLLDGEIVALERGRPSFRALGERMHVKDRAKAERLATVRPVTLMVFDLLRVMGQDITAQPWTVRRHLLEQAELAGPHWQVPPTYDDGEQLHRATKEQGLEGVVSKRRTSTYLSGRRSDDWRKLPHRDTISAVVGGWRYETDSTTKLGAVLIGIPGPDGWEYAGKMGSGLAGKAGAVLQQRLSGLEIEASPFASPVPREDAVGVVWVRPEVVVEARSLGPGKTGKLRQPAYLGTRTDLTAEDLRNG
ncbi:non-homologous end-joining DNA ligase [Actinomycetota bacterium]